MGGGPLNQNNNIPGPTYPYTEVPEQQASYEQQQQQYLAEQSRKRQEYQKRVMNKQWVYSHDAIKKLIPFYYCSRITILFLIVNPVGHPKQLLLLLPLHQCIPVTTQLNFKSTQFR